MVKLKCFYYAIFKVANIVLWVSLNRFTCMQGKKKHFSFLRK